MIILASSQSAATRRGVCRQHRSRIRDRSSPRYSALFLSFGGGALLQIGCWKMKDTTRHGRHCGPGVDLSTSHVTASWTCSGPGALAARVHAAQNGASSVSPPMRLAGPVLLRGAQGRAGRASWHGTRQPLHQPAACSSSSIGWRYHCINEAPPRHERTTRTDHDPARARSAARMWKGSPQDPKSHADQDRPQRQAQRCGHNNADDGRQVPSRVRNVRRSGICRSYFCVSRISQKWNKIGAYLSRAPWPSALRDGRAHRRSRSRQSLFLNVLRDLLYHIRLHTVLSGICRVRLRKPDQPVDALMQYCNKRPEFRQSR